MSRLPKNVLRSALHLLYQSEMTKFLQWLFLLLSLSLARAGPVTSLTNNPSGSSDGSQLPDSTLSAVIPTDFKITPSLPLDEPVLDQQDTLLLTLFALGSLALDDFNQEQRSQSWRAVEGVAIDILGPEKTFRSVLAARKYAIWGIYKAIHAMVALNDFRSRNYGLYWQGTLVGYVAFNKGPNSALSLRNSTTNGISQGVQERSLSISANASQNLTATALGSDRTIFSYHLYGRTVGESNVFMTLFTGILKAAPFPKDERVPEFFVNSRSFNSLLSFKEQSDLGPSGPFFEYEQLIQLFMELPLWTISHGSRWVEAEMMVLVDNKAVGTGVLKWQIRPEISGLNVVNVTTS